jgi:hypothetical protein
MAMPTSASARAGASLTPFPRHRHHAAFGPALLDDLTFCLGQHLDLELVDAELAGDRLPSLRRASACTEK